MDSGVYTVYKYVTAITSETAAAKDNELLYADPGSGVVDVVFSRAETGGGTSVAFLDGDSSVVVFSASGSGVEVVVFEIARVEFDDPPSVVENMPPPPWESNIGPIGRATFPAS